MEIGRVEVGHEIELGEGTTPPVSVGPRNYPTFT